MSVLRGLFGFITSYAYHITDFVRTLLRQTTVLHFIRVFMPVRFFWLLRM
ncbi:hypothetical protein ATORI0001_1312 [Lancefieldella rimae ATCC 49626]|uniref:Uncharacterized protein n=1 Tax=Lancefieldella rimae (strain ATCC 49626 / DSM 7090 / CCUG 31168 / NBRC 15546 / VPI D140H-11A) TaxID=553184 RepID=B9CLX8_LANR4|nr:hypothetical protein ATORI0001_1312 [Lancefieldella rimae ATCC 49626]